MKNFPLSIVASALIGLMSSGVAFAGQAPVDSISQFTLNYVVKDNLAAQHGVDCAKLGADWASCNKAVVTLLMTATLSPTKTGLSIFTVSVRS